MNVIKNTFYYSKMLPVNRNQKGTLAGKMHGSSVYWLTLCSQKKIRNILKIDTSEWMKSRNYRYFRHLTTATFRKKLLAKSAVQEPDRQCTARCVVVVYKIVCFSVSACVYQNSATVIMRSIYRSWSKRWHGTFQRLYLVDGVMGPICGWTQQKTAYYYTLKYIDSNKSDEY